jgi:TPR repeat protein
MSSSPHSWSARRRLAAAFALAVCTTATPLAAPAADDAGALTEAIGHYGRGEVDAARRGFEALAARGVPAADYNLAVMKLAGDLPGGAAGALPHLERAARAGFVTAMFGLGQVHEQGRLGPPDPRAAMHWYRLAAEAGSVDAQVEVATAHFLGRGAAKDPAQAAHWYREAAKGGDIGAQYLLASMYERGDGVARDLRLARYWYDDAAKNGDEAAPDKVRELDARLREAPR